MRCLTNFSVEIDKSLFINALYLLASVGYFDRTIAVQHVASGPYKISAYCPIACIRCLTKFSDEIDKSFFASAAA